MTKSYRFPPGLSDPSVPVSMCGPVVAGAPAEWRVRLYFSDRECTKPTLPGQSRVASTTLRFDNEMEARMHCAAHGGEYTLVDV